MKLRVWPLIPLIITGCQRTAAISGTLADPDEASHVRYEGGPGAVPLADAAFSFGRVRGDTIDLYFERDGDRVGWMRLVGVPRAATIELHGVWFDDERAFPTTLGMSRGRVIEVNGLRMGPPDRLPRRLDVRGSVLAAGRGGDAIVMRPADPGLPDLRVVLVPATSVSGVDGEPARADRLEFGDSVRLVGRSEAGYVIAEELILPRPGLSGGVTPTENRSVASPATNAAPGGGAERERESGSARDERSTDRDESRRAVPARPGPNPGRGRGRRD